MTLAVGRVPGARPTSRGFARRAFDDQSPERESPELAPRPNGLALARYTRGSPGASGGSAAQGLRPYSD